NSPHHVRARVGRRQTKQRRTRMRVEMRCTLAHEVGCPDQAITARLHLAGVVSELNVWIHSVYGWTIEVVAKPSQRKARGLRNAHDVPTASYCVAECVQPTPWVHRGTIGNCEHNARRADSRGHSSRCRASHSYSAGSLIACSRYNLSPKLQ